MTAKELREKRQTAYEAADKLTKTALAEDRDMTEEEETAFQGHTERMEELDKKISARETYEAGSTAADTRDTRISGDEAFSDDPEERAVQQQMEVEQRVEAACRTVRVPARCLPRSKMTAFPNTPDGQRDAYISAMWLMGAAFRHAPSLRFCQNLGLEMRYINESINSAGGFLVPTVMETAIINLRETVGIVRQYAGYRPMTSDSVTIPKRTGGVTAYFVGENKEVTDSQPTWGQVGLTAKKLMALSRQSSEITEDAAVSIADIIAREFAYAFAAKEDDCAINGDGGGIYGNIVGIRALMTDGDHDASTKQATSGDDQWGELIDLDVMTLPSMTPDYPGMVERWFISKVAWGQTMIRLTRAAGGTPGSELAMGIPKTFGGYEVVTNTVFPKASTAYNGTVMILFGDMSKAMTFGDRRGILMQVLTERYAEFSQIGLIASERFDVTVHDIGDGTDTGPMVGLVGQT